DCVMLRTQQTSLSTEDASRWATAVGESGGLVLVSDDLSLLGSNSRALLDEVIALGRANDTAYGVRGSVRRPSARACGRARGPVRRLREGRGALRARRSVRRRRRGSGRRW